MSGESVTRQKMAMRQNATLADVEHDPAKILVTRRASDWWNIPQIHVSTMKGVKYELIATHARHVLTSLIQHLPSVCDLSSPRSCCFVELLMSSALFL